MDNVIEVMMWLAKEGTMYRRITRISLAPSSSAAITKSSSLRARKRPRTTRAKPVQLVSDRISVMAK